MSHVLPTPPFYLSCLNRDDKLHITRLRNATVAEAGTVALQWSKERDVFIVIHDATGTRQGAFLNGAYIGTNIADSEMTAIAEAWQADRRDE